MSKQGQQGSNLIAQQGLAKSSSESTNFSESIKEHPSSSAPFGDKKDFFEKLSAQSDDQLQQGNVGQQGIKEDGNINNTQQGSSSELKKSGGSSSDIKKGSTFTTQQDSSSNLKESSTGSSDVKQESFKEHPSSSAPFGDKKDFFEKLSAQSDDQLQQGDVGQQGIRKDDNIINIQQGSSELKQSSGSSSDIKKGSTFTSQQDSSSNEWEEGSTGTSNVKQESFKEHPSSSAPFGDKKDFFEKLSAQSDDQLQQGDVGQQGVKEDENITTQQGSSELKKSSGSSSDIEKGSTYTSQQDSSNEWKEGSTGKSDVKKQESFKEHPSSSAPFGDKKDFFEKLSAQSDDQLQQGDVGQQGIKEDGNINTQQGSSSELKKSSGSSSDIKKGSTFTSQQDSSNEWKEGSTGKSDVKQESFKEHPSSSAPFEDKKDFFEKLSGQSDDQLQQGDVGQQGIKEDGNTNIQQGSSSELKKSSGSSSDIKKGSTFTSQQDSSNEWKEGSVGTSDVEKDSFGEQDEGSSLEQHGLISQQGLNWQGPHETEHGKQQTNLGKSEDSSELKKSSGSSSDIKKGSTFTSQQDSSNEWKEGSAGTSDVEKDSFGKQDKGSNFGNDEVKWQGPSDETEFNSFGNKVSSDLKQTSTTSEPKETSSDVKGTMTSKPEEGKRDSDLIDFGSETKQDKSSSEGGFDLSGEISNLKIDSSSSFGQTKKKSVETGPFYDDKVHDDRNDTK